MPEIPHSNEYGGSCSDLETWHDSTGRVRLTVGLETDLFTDVTATCKSQVTSL